MPKHIICLRKRLQILYLLVKIIIFDVSPGFNQTKIRVNNEIIMMFDENNVDVKIIKVPKWTSVLHGKQWKQ